MLTITQSGTLADQLSCRNENFYVLASQDSPVYVYHPGTIIDSILFTPTFSGFDKILWSSCKWNNSSIQAVLASQHEAYSATGKRDPGEHCRNFYYLISEITSI